VIYPSDTRKYQAVFCLSAVEKNVFLSLHWLILRWSPVTNRLSDIKLAQFPAPNIRDEQLKWAVIVSRYQQQWLLVKHKQRNTLESPGGKREAGESIMDCARRELYEEAGAIEFEISPLATYAIELENGTLSYGQLFFADITQLGPLPESEIEGVHLYSQIPENHTYPQVHPFLIDTVKQQFSIND